MAAHEFIWFHHRDQACLKINSNVPFFIYGYFEIHVKTGFAPVCRRNYPNNEGSLYAIFCRKWPSSKAEIIRNQNPSNLIYVHVQLIFKKKDKIGQGQCGHIHVCENVFKIFFSSPTAGGYKLNAWLWYPSGHKNLYQIL